MSNLIELLFESVSTNSLDFFVGELSVGSHLESVAASEGPELDLPSWTGNVLSILESAAPCASSISLKLDRVQLSGVVLGNALIQVLMNDGNVDVSISFMDSEINCETSDCVGALHRASLELSKVANACHVICGYEPAVDNKTRFFTDAKEGPLLRF